MSSVTAIPRVSTWLLLVLLVVATSPADSVAAIPTETSRERAGTTSATGSATLAELRNELADVKLSAAKPQPKDAWDKLSAVAALVSGLLVALIGGIATFLYNSRQSKAQAVRDERDIQLRRVETIQGFFEYLSGTDAGQKRAALVMIEKLDSELAIMLAKAFSDPGSRSALSEIAVSGDEHTAEEARLALEATLEALQASVVQIGDPMRATGFFVRADGVIATTDYVLDDGQTEVDVLLPNEVRLKATVLTRTPEEGVALLKVASGDCPALELAPDSSIPKLLQEVVVMGATPTGMKVSVGPVIAVDANFGEFADFNEVAVSGRGFLARLDIEPGQGGAPVVDATGRVTGVVYGSTRDDAEAKAILLPVEPLRRALERLEAE